jgi:outer membrane protein OmpA-like peptidoglycan-associated protein
MRKATLGVVVTTALALSCGAAFAQGSPSADSIINSLTPHGNLHPTTRGIRPLGPQDNAPVSPARPAAMTRPTSRLARRPATRTAMQRPPAASNEAGAPSVNLTVDFANNSARLTPAAVRTLDQLGRALSSQALSTFKFRIEGHTDTLGNADHNQTLSEQRADAVVDYLVNKFHVDRSRLEPVGLGETHLLVPTGNQVAEPRNRRVTVVNVGA